MEVLAAHCGSVTALDLTSCWQLTSVGLKAISNGRFSLFILLPRHSRSLVPVFLRILMTQVCLS